MRFLVLFCFGFFLLSVTVSPVYAAQRPLCPPTTAVNSSTIYPPATPGIIVINEVLSNPGSKTLWDCAAQTNSSWLELFNTQNQAYNLSSFAAFDRGIGTTRYYLTGNINIAAHGYLVIFPRLDIFSGQNPLIRLLFEGIVVDQVTIPTLGVDQSYARVPDGSNNWQMSNTPTIGASNTPMATPGVATPAPSGQNSNTGILPAGNGSLKQQNTNRPTTIPTKMPASPRSIGTQPAWNTLHLPQTAPATSPSPGTMPLSPTPTSTVQTSIWPFLPELIGLAGFSLVIGIIFSIYKYKKRQRAT